MPARPKGMNAPNTMTVSIRCPRRAGVEDAPCECICNPSAARVIGAAGKPVLDAPFADLVDLSEGKCLKVSATNLISHLPEGCLVSPLGPIDQPRLNVRAQRADFRDEGGKGHKMVGRLGLAAGSVNQGFLHALAGSDGAGALWLKAW